MHSSVLPAHILHFCICITFTWHALSHAQVRPKKGAQSQAFHPHPTCRYKLKSVATDLLQFLHSQGTRVALLPDLASHTPITPITAVSKGERQSSNEVFMVAPTSFGFNEQAAQVGPTAFCTWRKFVLHYISLSLCIIIRTSAAQRRTRHSGVAVKTTKLSR